MKTTSDNRHELHARAKRHGQDAGQPLCNVVEDGLLQTIGHAASRLYKLPDLRVGNPAADDPMERLSWPELRETIYATPSPTHLRPGTSVLPEPPTGDPSANKPQDNQSSGFTITHRLEK